MSNICGDPVPDMQGEWYCTKAMGHEGLHATSGPLHTRWSDQKGICPLCEHSMRCHDGNLCLYGCLSCHEAAR
jgi:hypothetical protein